MKITQLIRELERVLVSEPDINPDGEVFSEGCDCWGEVNDVVIMKDGDVLLAREAAEDEVEKAESGTLDPRHVVKDVPEHKDPDQFKEVLP